MDTYNGWKNYQTWLLYAWLTNDAEMYDETMRMTSEWVEGQYFDPITGLTDELRECVAYQINLGDDHAWSPFFRDLLDNTLADIDWHAIAVSFHDDYEDVTMET